MQDPESGTLHLVSGETIVADVIVAADGIHSVARAAVLGADISAKPSGHSAYRALVRLPMQLRTQGLLKLTPASQIPREAFADQPELLRYLDGDESGTGFCTWMAKDRRLVAYPCRGATYLNIVAIVVRLRRILSRAWDSSSDFRATSPCYSLISKPRTVARHGMRRVTLMSCSPRSRSSAMTRRRSCGKPDSLARSMRDVLSVCLQANYELRPLAASRAGPAQHLDQRQGHSHRRRRPRDAAACVPLLQLSSLSIVLIQTRAHRPGSGRRTGYRGR